MRTVANLWTSFASFTKLATTGRTQQTETRRAFYAGAHAMFVLLNEASETDSIDVGEANMERLHQELLEFRVALQRGEA